MWSLLQGEAGMKKRFTEAQIIGVLKEDEAGGMTESDAQRLKALEAENNKLKHL